MAAELKIGIGADISSLTKAVSDAKGKIGDLSNIKLPEIKGPKVEMPKMIPMPPMPEIPPIKVPPIPPIKIPPIDDKAVDDFLAKVDKIKGVGEQLSSIGQKMSVGLTLPILALGGSAIKAYGDIQSLQKGLEAVMGSTGAATKEFEKLKEVARLPGLGMEEAVKGSINLQAIGIDADRSRKILSQFGNAVASVGKGKAEFERAIYGVQQLANTDFPLGEDLNIIKDALPQVSNLLKEAFGSSRSDELAKMGVSSKQVLDTITAGLEKLPRVTGGINGAFENLGDSMKTSLARIGKIIDDTFDISGIIDKLTGYMDKAVSVFENFSPAVQKSILVVAGLAAAAGPLLVVVGGIMTALPGITMALGGLKVAFLAVTGPIGLAVTLLSALAAGFLVFSDYSRTAADRSAQWKDSLANANAEAATQVAKLRDLYNATQDNTKSVKERTDAVEELQRTYPVEFGNLSKQMILNGQAAGTYKSLAASIYDVARAKAAQRQIDKITEDSFNKEIELRKALNKEIENYKNPKAFNYTSGTAGSGIREATISAEEMQKRAADNIFKYVKALKAHGKATEAELKIYSDYVKKGFKEVETATVTGVDAAAAAIQKGANKTKSKPVELQIPIKVTIPAMAGLAESDPLSWLYSEDQLAIFKDRINNTVVPTLGGIITEAMLAIKNSAIEFNDSVNLMLQDNFVNMFAGIGEALITGASIMEIGKNAVLNTLGQFAIMFGKELMKTAAIAEIFSGLIIAIKSAISNPYALLAIAAAAIVVGSALTASAKNTANVGGGGGGYSSGGLSTGAGGGVANYTSSYSTGSTSNNEFRFVIMGDDLYSVMERAKAKHERLN